MVDPATFWMRSSFTHHERVCNKYTPRSGVRHVVGVPERASRTWGATRKYGGNTFDSRIWNFEITWMWWNDRFLSRSPGKQWNTKWESVKFQGTSKFRWNDRIFRDHQEFLQNFRWRDEFLNLYDNDKVTLRQSWDGFPTNLKILQCFRGISEKFTPTFDWSPKFCSSEVAPDEHSSRNDKLRTWQKSQNHLAYDLNLCCRKTGWRKLIVEQNVE